MLFMILLAAFALPPAQSAPPAGPSAASPSARAVVSQQPECRQATPRTADLPSTQGLRPRRLDELPQGRVELAVLREVDGCVIPAVLNEGIGNLPAPPQRFDRRR